jgi:hypothetical protein
MKVDASFCAEEVGEHAQVHLGAGRFAVLAVFESPGDPRGPSRSPADRPARHEHDRARRRRRAGPTGTRRLGVRRDGRGRPRHPGRSQQLDDVGDGVDRGPALGAVLADGNQGEHQQPHGADDAQVFDGRGAARALAPHGPPPTTAPTWRESSMSSTPRTRISTAGTIRSATTSWIFGAARAARSLAAWRRATRSASAWPSSARESGAPNSDPLLSDRSWAVSGYRPDVDALGAAPTRVVIAVGRRR